MTDLTRRGARRGHARGRSRALLTLAAGAVALALGMAWTTAAQAQAGLPTRRIGVAHRQGTPLVSFSARDLVNPVARDKLQSGLPQTIVMRVYAYAESGARPIAVAPRACRVTFDLWEEVYRVQLQSDQRDDSLVIPSLDAAIARCLVVDRLPVGRAADYRTGTRSVYFAVLAEFNPMSPDTVERIRRWLARPAGGRLGGEAFFGSFVSLFVNRRIGEAERVVRFRSPTTTVP